MNDVIWIGFRIDTDAVRPFLPEGLVLSRASIGVLGIYEAPTGHGLAPYRRGLVCVTVEGKPGSDVGEGMFVMGNIMDQPAADTMKQLYSQATIEGTARTWAEGGLLHGAASVDGEEWLRATIQPGAQRRPDMRGIDTFLGQTESGLVRYVDSTVADLVDAEVVSLEITDAAPDYFRALRPVEYVFALHAPQATSIWSEPRAVGRAPSSNAASVLLMLAEDTGRPVAVVREDGTLIEANASALRLLGHKPKPGEPLLHNLPEERRALHEALSRSVARTGPRVSDPILLRRPDGGHVLAHVLPLEHGEHGKDAALVMLADTEGPERRDAVRVLQLFGLTTAEARLAALVGTGSALKEAAGELGISEHTARSTLKTVYDKLGINKQSELGHLVARLQYL